MSFSLRLTLICVMFVMANATVAWSAPITFRATGALDIITDNPVCAPEYGYCYDPLFAKTPTGTAWQLDITFDPDAPGEEFYGGPIAFIYDAIISAEFQLGEFRYTNTLETTNFIVTNWTIPASSNEGGPGLVTFYFQGGWVFDEGAPDLNWGVGLFSAAWNDPSALDGSLPTSPAFLPQIPYYSGLLFATLTDYPYDSSFFSYDYRPYVVEEPVPTPEPSTLLLLTGGVVAVGVHRLRTSRRSVLATAVVRNHDEIESPENVRQV